MYMYNDYPGMECQRQKLPGTLHYAAAHVGACVQIYSS